MKWNHSFSPADADTNVNSNSNHVEEEGQSPVFSTVITVYLISSLSSFSQYLASLPPLFQRLTIHSLQPIILTFILLLWVILLSHPFFFFLLLSIACFYYIYRRIRKSLADHILEKNSLKYSLELISSLQQHELEVKEVDPSPDDNTKKTEPIRSSSILWNTIRNPINEGVFKEKVHEGRFRNQIIIEEDCPEEDEEGEENVNNCVGSNVNVKGIEMTSF